MHNITDHSIKVNRALKLSKIGDCPQSASAMLDALPASAISALTGAQIAEMLDAMWDMAQRSKAIAEREAVAEGAIWDARKGILREIAA